MKKKYTYKNAIIYVINPNKQPSNITKATKKFLQKVLAERKGD